MTDVLRDPTSAVIGSVGELLKKLLEALIPLIEDVPMTTIVEDVPV